MRPSASELVVLMRIDLRGGAFWERSEGPNDRGRLDAMVDAFLRGGVAARKSHCKISTG